MELYLGIHLSDAFHPSPTSALAQAGGCLFGMFTPGGMEHPGHIPISSYLRVLLDQELDWQWLVEVAARLAGSWSSSRLQGERRISNIYQKNK